MTPSHKRHKNFRSWEVVFAWFPKYCTPTNKWVWFKYVERAGFLYEDVLDYNKHAHHLQWRYKEYKPD